MYGIQTPLYVAAAAGVLAFLFCFLYKETAPAKVESIPNVDASVRV
jgi:MFS transporter, ACS family, hexuronate transporter